MALRYIGSIDGDSGYVDDPDGSLARFNNPIGLTKAQPGDDAIYVADFFNKAIRKIELVTGDYGVTTFADLSSLDCPYPRWLDLVRSGDKTLWCTCTDASFTNSQVISIDPFGNITEWTLSGAEIFGALMGIEDGGCVVRQHYNTAWMLVYLDDESVSLKEWQAPDSDPPCGTDSHWVYHRDGAFPTQDAGMCWTHTGPDGGEAACAHDYVYPSGHGICLEGTFTLGARYHAPGCRYNGSEAPPTPPDLTPAHGTAISDAVPDPAWNSTYSDPPQFAYFISQLSRGPSDSSTQHYLVSPVLNEPVGSVHLTYYVDNDGFNPLVDKTIGPAYGPCVSVAYWDDDDTYFMSFAHNSGPLIVHDGMSVGGFPLNTVAILFPRDEPPVGVLDVEVDQVPVVGMEQHPMVMRHEVEVYQVGLGVPPDPVIGNPIVEPALNVDPRPAADLPLPPDPPAIELPRPPWIPRDGHPYRSNN